VEKRFASEKPPAEAEYVKLLAQEEAIQEVCSGVWAYSQS
jgi:hypothetical protein